MKASYVEDATKRFIKTKVFNIFDKDIKNNKITDVKSLFRPIGFNIVLQACFGKELKTLSDPFWIKWNEYLSETNSKAVINAPLQLILGNTDFGDSLQKLLTGTSFKMQIDDLINMLDDYATNNNQANIINAKEKDKDIKLFNDYVEIILIMIKLNGQENIY